ncbi:hypothetical protein EsDP_00002700 [Epichloe bromicola]|uniref:Uncharacterized protein n=1 Tax=Epichloe bromicola TaxID=79588 RepID=A0ABQ0CLJ5_9HYPO
MDRARRTAATTRRKTLGDSASPRSTPPEGLSDRPAVGSPVMAPASAANSPQAGTRSRRGSKSLQQAFAFSAPASAPGTRGQVIKRRSRTMDSYGTPDDIFDQDSPRKGGHTLRKRARVDYTFEHVDDEVVVPNSTSSRAKKRRPDHSYDPEDIHDSGAKRRGASLGADTAAGMCKDAAHKSIAGGTDPGDDEDVKDTIEVGVSYSDMGDSSEIRRGSHSSASSVDHSFNGSWESAQTASHFGTLYPNEKHFADSKGAVDDNEEENIDPQLRASPPASPKRPAVAFGPGKALPGDVETQIAQDNRQGRPSAGQATDGKAAATSEDAQPPTSAAQSGAVRDEAADVSKDAATIPTEPAAGEQGSPVPETSVSDKTRHQLTAAEAAVSEPPDATNTGEPAGSPKLAQKSSSQLEHDPEAMHTSSAMPSSSMGASDETEAINDSAEGTTNDVEMSDTRQSPVRELHTTTIPSISIEQVAGSEEADAEEGEEEQLTKEEEEEEEEEEGDVASEESKRSPTSTEMDGKDKISEESDMTALGNKDSLKNRRPSQLGPSKPQPAPSGRWSHLTPYIDGEYVSYPEKKARSDDETGVDEATPEDKDADKDGNDMEPMVEDNDDAPDPAGLEAQTPALNTPLRGSPVPDSMDPTANNSPAPAGEDVDEGDMSDSQEQPERRRYFKYRKLRHADEYIAAIENYEDMSTTELYEVLEAINVSLVQWQGEWTDLGKVVDDYENSLRRRVADAKYEARTKNVTQHGVNHEEPEFAVKGYKAKERELMSETRYLQGQDRIMASTYGFEYDPHPSKIGRQNPETQQVGIMTRGRSLRNQPRQTVKASEADEVTGKRQRKPVQLFDPATQDVSRSSTPVPARGRRRRNVNADEDAQVNLTSSFNGDGNSDAESVAPRGRRRRGPRASNAAQAAEELATPRSSGARENEENGRSGRRRAVRQPARYDETYGEFMDDDAQPEPKQPPQQHQQRRRHLLTLKIPRSKNFSEPSSAITDNGDSRPSTASSDSTSHTAESSYSFRPKRQKRFRDDADESEEATQAPSRKRGKRSVPHSMGGVESSFMLDQRMPDAPHNVRKLHKIKIVRPAQDVRHESPSSTAGGDGDEKPKDYKSMTKSEKMSASMKSRWANGNMAGAVEKRKATLAAKKAAQAVADSKVGAIAPKPKVKPHKKEGSSQGHPCAGYVPAMPGIGYPFSANQ